MSEVRKQIRAMGLDEELEDNDREEIEEAYKTITALREENRRLKELVMALPLLAGEIASRPTIDGAWFIDHHDAGIRGKYKEDGRAIAALLAYRATLQPTMPTRDGGEG